MADQQFTILHLSDFHFSKRRLPNIEASRAIDSLISHLKREVHLVVVTGDTSDCGSPDGFQKAIDPLRRLAQHFTIEPTDLFFVPGNHDMEFMSSDPSRRPSGRFSGYIEFVNLVRQMGQSRRVINWGVDEVGGDSSNTCVLYRNPHHPIDFLLLNSVVHYTPRNQVIKIPMRQIKYFDDHAETLRRRKTVKFAIVHNAPVMLSVSSESRRNKGAKIIENNVQLLNVLQKCGASVLLHGDLHDTQQAATARRLHEGSWPLYSLGAGRMGDGGRGFPQCHCLNIKCVPSLNSCEIEVVSYLIRADTLLLLAELCYTLYVPLYEPPEKRKEIEESKASVHIFEKPDGYRHDCASQIAKDLLFNYRANSFELVVTRARQLLRHRETQFLPSEMYSLFYKSVFASAGEGDHFRALHTSNYDDWLDDKSCIEILDAHRKAVREGLCIERVIILGDSEIEADWPHLEKLSTLVRLMARYSIGRAIDEKHFITYIARERDLRGYFSKCESKRVAGMVGISVGNIALFTRGSRPQDADVGNSLGFYYTYAGGRRKRKGMRPFEATLITELEKINYLKDCICMINVFKGKPRRKPSRKRFLRLLDCRKLRSKDTLRRFLDLRN